MPFPGEEVAAGPRAGFLPCDLPARRKEASHRPHDAEPAASEGFCLRGDRDEADLKLLAEVTQGRGSGILSSWSRELVLPAKRETALKQLMLHASKRRNLTAPHSSACLETFGDFCLLKKKKSSRLSGSLNAAFWALLQPRHTYE